MLKHKLLKYRQPTFRWKWVYVSGLVILLAIIGHQEAYIKDVLVSFFSKIYYLFLNDDIESSFLPVPKYILNSMISLSYRLLYCSVCLLLINAYFGKPMITKLAFILYLLLFGLTIGLYLAAFHLKSPQLHIVAFRVDTLLVSPMPVIILIPALYLQISLKK